MQIPPSSLAIPIQNMWCYVQELAFLTTALGDSGASGPRTL